MQLTLLHCNKRNEVYNYIQKERKNPGKHTDYKNEACCKINT